MPASLNLKRSAVQQNLRVCSHRTLLIFTNFAFLHKKSALLYRKSHRIILYFKDGEIRRVATLIRGKTAHSTDTDISLRLTLAHVAEYSEKFSFDRTLSSPFNALRSAVLSATTALCECNKHFYLCLIGFEGHIQLYNNILTQYMRFVKSFLSFFIKNGILTSILSEL